jgi:malonyl-CoA/methylmalonyl-CoA synthetase
VSGLPELMQRALDHGTRVAFTETNGQVTYAQLLERSETIAATLLNGASDLNEQRIAFAAPAGSDYAAIQWAIWRAGGIAVPLNIHATTGELQHCTGDAAVTTLVTLSGLLEQFAPLCEAQGINLICLDQLSLEQRCTLPELDLSRRAMIIFTSGTTSKPKGVVTTHCNIQAQVTTLIDAWQWQAEDVIPLFLPMHHVHGIINVMTCALWAGATIDAYEDGFDLPRVCQRVSEQAYTLFMAVPTIYVKLIQALEQMDPAEKTATCAGFATMRLMVSGSAALPVTIHQQWRQLTGQVLLERYGMTEIGMALSNPYDGERRPGCVGMPLPGVAVELHDEEGQIVTTEGEPGEIWVQGSNVFLEYWQNPKATAESFTRQWFHTGDVAVLEGGYYRIMGRQSVDIIKSGGYKLSALEIENVLLDHPAIAECAVVGIEDPTWGELVAAALVIRAGHTLTRESLAQWASDKMSGYKIPRKLVFANDLPRNAMGKVIKAEVAALVR